MKENKLRVPARIYDYPDKNDTNKIIAEIDVTKEDIIGALARGYCLDRNTSKVLDAVLIESMAEEVGKLFTKGNPKEEEMDEKDIEDWI